MPLLRKKTGKPGTRFRRKAAYASLDVILEEVLPDKATDTESEADSLEDLIEHTLPDRQRGAPFNESDDDGDGAGDDVMEQLARKSIAVLRPSLREVFVENWRELALARPLKAATSVWVHRVGHGRLHAGQGGQRAEHDDRAACLISHSVRE